MLEFLRTKVVPIGIDLGSSSLKLVQLCATEGRIELVAAAACEVPQEIRNNPDFLHEWYIPTIRQVLSSGSFRGRRAVTCLPARDVVTHHLRLSKGNPDELSEMVAVEAQEKLSFNVSPQLLQYVVAGEVYDGEEAKLEVILMALDQAGLDRHLELLDRTKLESLTISVEPVAMLRALSPLLQQEDILGNAIMFVDLGREASRIAIAHGEELAFCRTLNIASSAESASHLVKRLSEEIRKCLLYHDSVFQERPVTQLIFVGGGAKDASLCEQLGAAARLDHQRGDPLARIAEDTLSGAHSDFVEGGNNCDWTVAVGLSLQGIEAQQSEMKKPAVQTLGEKETVRG